MLFTTLEFKKSPKAELFALEIKLRMADTPELDEPAEARPWR
jgi:hypothetical protein